MNLAARNLGNWALAGLTTMVLLPGCDKKGNYVPTSQELHLNLHSEPPTIDPRKATDTVSISVIDLCFEGLTRINSDGKPILAVAENIEISSDKKTYTFTLRDVKWSDGKAVSAYDFEATWKTMLNPTFPCEFTSDLYIIKNAQSAKSGSCQLDEVSIWALDDKTLKVELLHPVPYFLSALATHSFFATPLHITSIHPNWTEKHYVGNGPFSIKEWKHQDKILLEKNPNYWDTESTKLERVTLAIVEDLTTELTMYENGELDWAGSPLSNLPTEALSSLKREGKLNTYAISGTYFYVFNTKEFPFTNSNIRKAFAMAINRTSIIANVLQMGQKPAMGLIPPTIWKDHTAYFKDGDLAEAKTLFAKGLIELGITAAELPAISLSYNTDVGHHKIAQAIQEQWNLAFGIRVKLENKEWKVFLDELRHHKFQIARMGGLANINDPSTFLDYYRYISSSNNFSQWDSPRFSELLEEADLTPSVAERTALLKSAEKMLMDAMPIAPIYFYTGVYLKKPYVKGINLSELNTLDLKSAYVEIYDPVSR